MKIKLKFLDFISLINANSFGLKQLAILWKRFTVEQYCFILCDTYSWSQNNWNLSGLTDTIQDIFSFNFFKTTTRLQQSIAYKRQLDATLNRHCSSGCMNIKRCFFLYLVTVYTQWQFYCLKVALKIFYRKK